MLVITAFFPVEMFSELAFEIAQLMKKMKNGMLSVPVYSGESQILLRS